jgi:hypothetical protein
MRTSGFAEITLAARQPYAAKPDARIGLIDLDYIAAGD